MKRRDAIRKIFNFYSRSFYQHISRRPVRIRVVNKVILLHLCIVDGLVLLELLLTCLIERLQWNRWNQIMTEYMDKIPFHPIGELWICHGELSVINKRFLNPHFFDWSSDALLFMGSKN